MGWCRCVGVATLVALLLPTLNSATESLTAPYYQHRIGGMMKGDSYDDPEEMADVPVHLSDSSNDDQVRVISRYLARILVQPWPDNHLPLLYVEDTDSSAEADAYPTTASTGRQTNEPATKQEQRQLYDMQEEDTDVEDSIADDDHDALTMNNDKRNRYYRKYPWKRQNARQTYDADNRYLCQPSKDDVFRLLVALHDSKGGNRRPIHFCNRKRPAHTIFTNIRFLGK